MYAARFLVSARERLLPLHIDRAVYLPHLVYLCRQQVSESVARAIRPRPLA
jgi:hypothetical protein